MILSKRLPHLSLIVAGVEIYPLIVREVTRKVVSRSPKDAGSADLEDFLSEAVFRVLHTTKRRYTGQTRVSTFVFKRIGGSYMDLMRKEMRYQTKNTLAADCPDGKLPDTSYAGLEESVSNRLLWVKVRTVIRQALPPLEREILIQHYFHGATMAMIADNLWIELRQAKEAHSSALAEVRRHFPRGQGVFVS